MDNIIIVSFIVLIVVLALLYIIKAKKSGKKCIGCPNACSCKNQSQCKSYETTTYIK